MVKEAMGRQQKSMKGMEEILKIPGTGEECIKILVIGVCNIVIPHGKKDFFPTGNHVFFTCQFSILSAKPGMGKSSSMAYLAMKWVNDKTGGEYLTVLIINYLRDSYIGIRKLMFQ